MTAMRPRVKRERKRAQAGGFHDRTELVKSDQHRLRGIRERKAGVPARSSKPGAKTARAVASKRARQQPRDVLGRFVSIVDKEAVKARDEIIWGRSQGIRRSDYPKRRDVKGEAKTTKRDPRLKYDGHSAALSGKVRNARARIRGVQR